MSVPGPAPLAIQPPRPPTRTEVDDQHPWPGLNPFTEELSEYFNGRSGESGELLRRVKRELLTVLFGTSGLGKTSLLCAGLFPLLRVEGLMPVYIRLDHEATAKAPVLQVKEALIKAIKEARILQPSLPETSETETDESLWEFFHRKDIHLQAWNGQPITPVLVFDQFEELFTLGTRDEAEHRKYESFFSQLSDLVENHPPTKVRERLRSNPEQITDLDFGPARVRVLFSLREDYLANLEEYSELIPSILRNRMRLKRMNGQQALDAVVLTGAELVSREVGEQIVRFVAAGAAQRKDKADGAGPPAARLRELEVEPALLSLFCRELNEQRIAEGLPQITAQLVEKSSGQILTAFYEKCFAGQATGARIFVEEKLLTSDGLYRDDMEVHRAKEVLEELGAPAACLDELIMSRLLHSTRRGENLRVELTHDVLVRVVRDSRTQRRLSEERRRTAEAEKKAAEAEEMAERSDRQRKLAWVVAAILGVATVSLAWVILDGWVFERATYYENFAKRYGIMEGVGKLSASQVSHRATSYRFITRGRFGPLLKVQAVDSGGRLVARNAVGTYLSYAWEDTRKERECQWEFVLDHRGLVVYEKAKDRFGRLVWGFIYLLPTEPAAAEGTSASSTRPRTVKGHYVGPDGYPMPLRGSSAEYVEITYNQDGYEEEVFYQDRNRNPMPGPDGAYGKNRRFNRLGLETEQTSLDSSKNRLVDQEGNCGLEETYDAMGNVVRAQAFDIGGHPTSVKKGWTVVEEKYDSFGNLIEEAYSNEMGKLISTKDGYARWTARYDERGNPVEMAYFDEAGNPALSNDGYARWTAEHDGLGNQIETAYFDKVGKPVLSRDGFAHWTAKYDERGYQIETAYFNEADKPVPSKDGYARWTAKYNKRGELIEAAYFDEADNPVLTKNGFARWIAKHDARGNPIETAYFDEAGNPALSEDGCARWTAQYDERGNQIETAYFDEAGNPVLTKNGFARWTAQYDQRGNQIKTAYFDETGNPVLTKNGFASWTAQYDTRGKQLETAYFDEAGNPVPSTYGYARWTAKYDERGNQIETAYFDVAGNPALSKEGLACWTAKYDERSKQLETAYFDVAGKPVPSAYGYARWTAKYDKRDKQLETAYFDVAGKPVRTTYGYARWTAKYDERGNQIETAYFDVAGNPALSDDGCARWTAKYDEHDNQIETAYFDVAGNQSWIGKRDKRGNPIESAYFDVAGNPVLSINGYARWTAKYDEHGKQIESAYFDVAGNPVLSTNGYARWTAKYDERGNQIEIAYFDEAGKPMLSKDGFARKAASYDKRRRLTQAAFFDERGQKIQSKQQMWDEKGNLVEEAYFDGAGRATLNSGGISIARRTYDENGKLIEAVFFDANGEPIQTLVEIQEVESGSQGERAGLRSGDVVLNYDRTEVTNTSQLQAMISAPGPSLREITISRAGVEHRLQVRSGHLGGVIMRERAKAKENGTPAREDH